MDDLFLGLTPAGQNNYARTRAPLGGPHDGGLNFGLAFQHAGTGANGESRAEQPLVLPATVGWDGIVTGSSVPQGTPSPSLNAGSQQITPNPIGTTIAALTFELKDAAGGAQVLPSVAGIDGSAPDPISSPDDATHLTIGPDIGVVLQHSLTDPSDPAPLSLLDASQMLAAAAATGVEQARPTDQTINPSQELSTLNVGAIHAALYDLPVMDGDLPLVLPATGLSPKSVLVFVPSIPDAQSFPPPGGGGLAMQRSSAPVGAALFADAGHSRDPSSHPTPQVLPGLVPRVATGANIAGSQALSLAGVGPDIPTASSVPPSTKGQQVPSAAPVAKFETMADQPMRPGPPPATPVPAMGGPAVDGPETIQSPTQQTRDTTPSRSPAAADGPPLRTGSWNAPAPGMTPAFPLPQLPDRLAITPAVSDPAELPINVPFATELGLASAPLSPVGAAPGSAALPHAPSTMANAAAQQIAAALTDPTRDTGAPLELALDPPELGRVRLQITELAGVMTLTIQAERPETADLIRRHLDLLAQEFAASGLDAPSVRISQDGQGNGQGSTGEDPATPAPDLPEAEDARTSPNRTQEGRLDLRL